ncbi:response regulator [Candidatus Poribacteria bacterium]|nr:response regulator [Candidatus Poribacteria bacterium]
MNDKPIQILLIEDDPRDADFLREMLSEVTRPSLEVEQADRLLVGLKRLTTGEIDVVLLDLSLPDSYGVDTLVTVHAQAPEVPIVVLTGMDDEAWAIQAVGKGAQDYLVKGQIDAPLLVRAIRYAIERQRLLDALRTSEARFRRLADNAQDIIYRYRFFPTRGFEYVSPAVTKITGYTPEAHYADPDLGFKIVHPEDRKQLQQAVENAQTTPLVLRWVRKEGSIVWMELHNTYIYDAEGKLVALEGIARDITERMQAEKELQESNRRLEEALEELRATQQQVIRQERLYALGTMASGIAHDFNNALSPILGFTEMLLDCPDMLDDKGRVIHALQMMNIAAKDAANTVRHLREFYRPREANENFQPCDLNQLVGVAISLTQPRWKAQAEAKGIPLCLKTDLQPIPLIAGVEVELREVLINLIFNAVDAMPDGGTITLRTRLDGNHVTLEVSDTGIGMTEEVKQHCLEPFFSTKGERGTGLGLAMVYGIIQRHRGTIAIESELGVGTTVHICLPVPKGQGAADNGRAAKVVSGPLHVLVVDDEPLVTEIIADYLTGDGHTVETATDGWDALEKFQKGWFDFVITDQAMPGMSGDRLAAVIKRIAPTKPIILLTGFGDLMNEAGEKPANVDFIVSKPITLSMFREVLHQVNSSLLR